jgi:hypothetical protein
MTGQVIPAEAVKAAAKAIAEHEGYGWLSKPANVHQEKALKAIEAAAPYMLASAWDEGKDAVWTFLGNQDPQRERPTNPYRTPNAV